MNLVIDANIIFSALIAKKGKTRSILLSDNFILHAPEFIYDEIYNNKMEIINRAKISEYEFDVAMSLIFSKITIVPISEFYPFVKRAREISPDIKDIIYLALALYCECPLWTDEKSLKEKQSEIPVYSTSDLIAKYKF